MVKKADAQLDSSGGGLTLRHFLATPSYGWEHEDGSLYVPSAGELAREYLLRVNVLRTRKNWVAFFSWFVALLLAIPLGVFFAFYFSWPLLAAGFVYGMVVLGTHGTFYLHRYSTHRAFRFKNRAWLFVAKNLVLRIVPEELYVVSHHVHHKHCEQPGDPYNAHAGWLYCFLADANHQPIARDLSAHEYGRVSKLVDHCGFRLNTYAQYQRWGSLSHPLRVASSTALNWAFWYAAFWAMGGHALAVALFGSACVWAVGVRTFNYAGHGGGVDRRSKSDFNRRDLSVNQLWPGFVAGEWHNNHHLYPSSARSGFLPYQLDLAWWLMRSFHGLGGIASFRDSKAAFMRDHYSMRANAVAQEDCR